MKINPPKMSIKVLHVTRQFYPSSGGIETSVLNLCMTLNTPNLTTEILTLNKLWDSAEYLKADDQINNIHIYRIPYVGGKKYAIAPEVLKYVKHYDIIHLHSSDFFLDFLSLTHFLYKVPLVLTTHGLYFHTPFAKRTKKIYLNTVTRLALRQISAVICVSRHDLNILKNVTEVNKLHIIPNGVAPSFFSTPENLRESNLILSVGRLSINKRYHLLIEVMPKILSEVPNARLLIIGRDQGELNELRHRTVQLGITNQVLFLGEVTDNDLANYLARASVWVSASEYESFGIAALEAMASGCIPVVQQLSAFEDFIHDQENGFFTDFTNAELAAKAILRVLKMGDEGRKIISHRAKETASCFTWESIAAQVENVYQKVLSGS